MFLRPQQLHGSYVGCNSLCCCVGFRVLCSGFGSLSSPQRSSLMALSGLQFARFNPLSSLSQSFLEFLPLPTSRAPQVVALAHDPFQFLLSLSFSSLFSDCLRGFYKLFGGFWGILGVSRSFGDCCPVFGEFCFFSPSYFWRV